MNATFDTLVLPSFFLFLDHRLQDRAAAYANTTGSLYGYIDAKFGSGAFGSNYNQWTYDSSIGGAIIPSGVYLDGIYTTGAAAKIDFMNGRVLSNSSPASVTGSFCYKEVNLYMNELSETVLVERARETARQKYENNLAYCPPYSVVAPFINLSYVNSSNKGWALGGEDETKILVRATVLTDNNYRAATIMSHLRDMNALCFAYISNASDLPFDVFGGLKTPGWNYNSVAAGYTDKIWIERVFCSRVSEVVNEQGENFYLGVAEFDLRGYRFPRA